MPRNRNKTSDPRLKIAPQAAHVLAEVQLRCSRLKLVADEALAVDVEGVDAVLSDVGRTPLAVACAAYIAVRDAYDALTEQAKALGELRRQLQYEVLPPVFERDGVTTVTLEQGYRCTVSETVRASMKDKEQAIKWLRGHNLGDIIQSTVNAQTLAATARSLMEEGKNLDPDVFNVAIVHSVSATKV